MLYFILSRLIDNYTKIQSNPVMSSLVVEICHRSIMTCLAKKICTRLISSTIGSRHGIHVTMDKAYGRYEKLNVKRRIVLRQYY